MAFPYSKINREGDGDMSAFRYEIVRHIATLSETNDGSKELNIVSFNGKPQKYDIRTWRRDENGERMLKGVTLSDEEMQILKNAIAEL